MTKNEFLSALSMRLTGLPTEDINKSLEYYSEIMEDRIEDGLAEEEAVAAIGSVDDVVNEILSNISLPKIVKEGVKPKRSLKIWELVLLILGSPIWLSIAVAVAAVLLSVYIVLWAVVTVFYSVTLSFAAGGIAGILGTVFLAAKGELLQGLLMFGAGLICAGLAILFFHLSNLTAKGVLVLGRIIILGIKRCFIGREAV